MHFSKSKKYLLFFNYLISPFSCKTIKPTIHILSTSLSILLFYIIFILPISQYRSSIELHGYNLYARDITI